MIWITLLIVLGLLLLAVEVLLLPGITVAGVGAFCSLVAAVVWAFVSEGTTTGIIVLAIVAGLLLVGTIIVLRLGLWHRLALKTNIESQVQPEEISREVGIGVQGIALTRLAPMGKVTIDGKNYEAKSQDAYIDVRSEVVVIGYENANLIVKRKNY